MSQLAIKKDHEYKQYVHVLGNALEEYPLCVVVGMLCEAVEIEQAKHDETTNEYKNIQLVTEALEEFMRFTELCLANTSEKGRLLDRYLLQQAISQIKVMS